MRTIPLIVFFLTISTLAFTTTPLPFATDIHQCLADKSAYQITNDEDLIQQLQDGLLQVYKKVEFGNFSAGKDGDIITLTGDGEVYNEAVSFTGQFSTNRKLVAIKMSFGPGEKISNSKFKKLAYKQSPKEFFPRELQRTIVVKEIAIGFEESTQKPDDFSIYLASNHNWNVFSIGSFTLNNIEGGIHIEQLQSRKKVTASLRGGFSIDGTYVTVEGTGGSNAEDWTFGSTINNLSITSIIKEVVGGNAFGGIYMPDKMFEVSVHSAHLYIAPKNKEFSVIGNTSLGQGELKINPDPANQNRLGFLVGFSPENIAEEFKGISYELFQAVDALQLNNFGFVLSSFKSSSQQTSLAIFKKLGGSTTIYQGLNFVGAYDLTQYNLDDLLNVQYAFVNVVVSPDPSKMWFKAGINSTIPLGKEASIRQIVLGLKPDPSNFQCTIGGLMDFKIDNQLLHFKSKIIVDVTDQSLALEGFLSGEWKDPFGAKGLTVDSLGVLFGASFTTTPIPLPQLGMSGVLKIGNFAGDLRVLVNSRNPAESALDVGFNQIHMKDILNQFCTPSVQNSIPPDIKNTVSSLSMTNARLTVVPRDMTLFEKDYTAGFRIAGDVKVNDMGGRLDVKIDYNNGIDAQAEVIKIDHSPYFKLSSYDGTGNPSLRIVLKPSTDSKVAVEGLVNVLDIEARGSMFINDQGFEVKTSGQIFDLFQAEVLVAGSRVQDGGSFRAAVTMEQDFMNYLSKEASEDIDEASKASQRMFSAAVSDIEKWQKEVNRLNNNISQAKAKAKKDRQSNIDHINAAKQDVTNAKNAVSNHLAKIKKNEERIAAEEKITNDKWAWAKSTSDPIEWVRRKAIATEFAASREASIIAPLRLENARLYTEKATVEAAVWTAEKTLEATRETYKVIPVEAYPEVVSLEALKGTANAELEAAKLIVKGTGFATYGSFEAAKWIVENANPLGIVNVTYAHFEGQLSMVDGGNVTLHVKGTFADDPFDTRITYDFQNPVSYIEQFAEDLMK